MKLVTVKLRINYTPGEAAELSSVCDGNVMEKTVIVITVFSVNLTLTMSERFFVTAPQRRWQGLNNQHV